jgi:hypothetical protein
MYKLKYQLNKVSDSAQSAGHICSNEVNYLEVNRANGCHAASLYNTNTVQGIVCDGSELMNISYCQEREDDNCGNRIFFHCSRLLIFPT